MRVPLRPTCCRTSRTIASLLAPCLVLFILDCGRRKEPLPLDAETESAVAVLEPGGVGTSGPLPLVIALHGHAQTEQQFVEVWNDGFFYQPNFILASVRAPFLSGEGYSWTARPTSCRDVPEDARVMRFAATAEVRIMALLDSLQAQHDIDPDNVYIVGASQGAAIAAYVFLRHTDVFAGLGMVAGNMDSRISAPPRGDALQGLRVFLSVGDGEGRQIVEAMETTDSLFAMAGADVRFFGHPEGHVITQPVIRAMQNHLGLSLGEAPEVERIEVSPGRFGDEGDDEPPATKDEYYDE